MSTAWKERKEAMEDLLKILGTPRYAEGSYGELAHAVAKVTDGGPVSSITLSFTFDWPPPHHSALPTPISLLLL